VTNPETDRRAQWATALWEAAEHHTIAEWICCDPINPKHGLCVAGGKALEMLRALIVDDPEAYKPAPLTTVALELAAVSVPPPAPRADAEAVDEPPLSPDYEHPDCGFHWHGRDGMDIPMRDGQPVCPRCELRRVEKLLDHRERRCDELRAESKRRGKVKLEYAEKIRLLERQIDEVRRQLGAEILRAGQAEAELRRMADEAQQPDDEALRAKVDEATATLRRIRSTIRTLKDQGATGRAYYQAISDDLAGPRPDRYEADGEQQPGGPCVAGEQQPEPTVADRYGEDHSCAEAGCSGDPGPVAGEQQNETPEADDYERTTGHLITCLAVAGGGSDPDCPCARPHP
jgi:hypothetical protein